MTMMDELKNKQNAIIVSINQDFKIKEDLGSRGIREGSMIQIISNFGYVTFRVNDKIFSMSKGWASNIKVICLN